MSRLSDEELDKPVHGYLLLPPGRAPGYRGVDRDYYFDFLSAVPPEPAYAYLLDPLSSVPPRFWPQLPPGWRQDATRIYEEHYFWLPNHRLMLMDDARAAHAIRRLVEPHLGPYEVVSCVLVPLAGIGTLPPAPAEGFLGYDVAYPGGDMWSAIAEGMLVNGDPDLLAEFGPLLNEYRLFPTVDPIPRYMGRYREADPIEGKHEFWVYQLALAAEG